VFYFGYLNTKETNQNTKVIKKKKENKQAKQLLVTTIRFYDPGVFGGAFGPIFGEEEALKKGSIP